MARYFLLDSYPGVPVMLAIEVSRGVALRNMLID